MPVLIETPRQNRFKTMEDAIIGPVEKMALDMLHKFKGGRKPVVPTGKFEITSTGKLRKHVLDNLVSKQMAESRYDNRLGGNVYSITRKGEEARLKADISKLPPSGYRKVLRGRPALKVVGRRAA
jgi:hypothetical protein